jgi:hypothetical protein
VVIAALSTKFSNKKGVTLKMELMVAEAGLPDFSWSKHAKTGKVYQMAISYTKWP